MLESWGLCQQKFVFPAEILAFLLQRARSNPCREKMLYWLVVSTHLKNIDQLGLLFPIYGKTMFQTTNQFISETFRNLPKRPFFTWDIGRNDRRWMKHSDIPTGSQELSIQSWGQIPKSSSRHEWPWLSIETYWNILKHIETYWNILKHWNPWWLWDLLLCLWKIPCPGPFPASNLASQHAHPNHRKQLLRWSTCSNLWRDRRSSHFVIGWPE